MFDHHDAHGLPTTCEAANAELAELRRDDEIAQDAIGDLNDKVVRAIKAQAAAERELAEFTQHLADGPLPDDVETLRRYVRYARGTAQYVNRANAKLREQLAAARASVADLEQAQTTARAELERMTADRDFWKEQQQFAASVAGTIADLDEQTPAVRKLLRNERDRRKVTEAYLDKTMFILQDAGMEQGSYERVPESVRLLVEQRDAALARSVLIEPDSRRTCPRCGTSWTVEVDACPRCQDAAPAGDGAAETGSVRADRYMMATTAHHKTGDISRDDPDLAIIDGEDGDDYIGQWAAGMGFVNVRFPKATTRDLTAEERAYYRTRVLEMGGRVLPIVIPEPDATPLPSGGTSEVGS